MISGVGRVETNEKRCPGVQQTGFPSWNRLLQNCTLTTFLNVVDPLRNFPSAKTYPFNRRGSAHGLTQYVMQVLAGVSGSDEFLKLLTERSADRGFWFRAPILVVAQQEIAPKNPRQRFKHGRIPDHQLRTQHGHLSNARISEAKEQEHRAGHY